MRGHRRLSSLRIIGRYACAGLLACAFSGFTQVVNAGASSWPTPPAASTPPPPQISGPLQGGTADHTKFAELKGPFENGSQVTQACLSCHTETGQHFMKNIHWTWSYQDKNTGQQLGKRYLINNFCTNSRGNEGMCAQCHAGYGWKDEGFDFTDETKIDCLVCHETTGTYYKKPNSEGSPACSVMFEGKPPIDFAAAAQSVDLPQRANCGFCHFNGGGGDNVKHGDLSTALTQPPRSLDVHMGVDGLNFACTACHVTNKHVWAGSRYQIISKDTEGTGLPGQRTDVATCESCHGLAPHPVDSLAGFKLNDHVQSIACQTCHIPEFARGGVATVIDWDWRTAGKTRDGEGYHEEGYIQGNGDHRYTYKSIKGDFVYDENIIPEYDWFDGQMVYTTIDTQFDPNAKEIEINGFSGSREDKRSRIWPFKRMHTWQPYDKGNGTLVYTHLWGEDDTAYWGNYDMGAAIEKGMADFGLDYSGEFGFIETLSWWPITHMVTPKEQALACGDCHTPKDSRLAEVKGVYLPGRDRNRWLDIIGTLIVAGTLGGILIHAGIRFFSPKGSHH
ncbi:tetrathionate reductase family octaheme c-type cytochrome [Lamprobacter modestohalophilus]|uniref:tetrathionate reductase family octaheme c-type cytochrome n=1 Tax=Lamprobacter modestohalophilus TaxID=1064514 RepID=UPI002ADECDC1|nr:tetrathionate reductase family octaheme c-type cytochrome [Lamprobacter modestohalophilus]MEA1050437.1 tetrathionate reductase family octaheme c-type cytochrome [Lamprobacter modestohalophilus]